MYILLLITSAIKYLMHHNNSIHCVSHPCLPQPWNILNILPLVKQNGNIMCVIKQCYSYVYISLRNKHLHDKIILIYFLLHNTRHPPVFVNQGTSEDKINFLHFSSNRNQKEKKDPNICTYTSNRRIFLCCMHNYNFIMFLTQQFNNLNMRCYLCTESKLPTEK